MPELYSSLAAQEPLHLEAIVRRRQLIVGHQNRVQLNNVNYRSKRYLLPMQILIEMMFVRLMRYLQLKNYVRFDPREIHEPMFQFEYRVVEVGAHLTSGRQNPEFVWLLVAMEASE